MAEGPVESNATTSDNTTSETDDRGLIAGFLYNVTVRGWNEYLSPPSLPYFRGLNSHYRRDLSVLAMAFFSIMAFVLWPYLPICRWLMVAWVFYRLVDNSSALISQAFFDKVREPRRLSDFGDQRIQRILVLILVSYVELLFIFAVVYLRIGESTHGSFNVSSLSQVRAFLLSMSTMTTVGFGTVSPENAIAVGVTTYQAVLGVIVFVVFVGTVLGLKNGKAGKLMPDPELPKSRVIGPLLTFVTFLLVSWFWSSCATKCIVACLIVGFVVWAQMKERNAES
ncbi:MAG TPA: ion channel [Phycisphaerae bacterium]|nr:ion channel [Phycisphaerae bacterium]